MDRRNFLSTGTALAAAAALGAPRIAAAAPGNGFQFIHFTDPHIQPELHATEGCLKCFEQIDRVPADFAIAGGDLIYDALLVGKARATGLFDLYQRAVGNLRMPVHSVIGNHDILGIAKSAGVPASDPLYGKKLYEDRLGARYYAFDHKGWHFIVLDSIGITPEPGYRGWIDEEQMDWLRADLERTGRNTPIIVTTHIPLFSGWPAIGMKPDQKLGSILIENRHQVWELLSRYKVKAVLQGHVHIWETIDYNGTKFITSGAVSGNWWRGVRAGTREGFAVIKVRGEEVEASYHPYGWVAAIEDITAPR